MNHADYENLVLDLAKPGSAIKGHLTENQCHLLHMAMGMMGELGEVIDEVKKSIMYERPLLLDKVIEELGDFEFYAEGLRIGLGITRDMTLEHNYKKLSKRYQSGKYSNAQAINRADEVIK